MTMLTIVPPHINPTPHVIELVSLVDPCVVTVKGTIFCSNTKGLTYSINLTNRETLSFFVYTRKKPHTGEKQSVKNVWYEYPTLIEAVKFYNDLP